MVYVPTPGPLQAKIILVLYAHYKLELEQAYDKVLPFTPRAITTERIAAMIRDAWHSDVRPVSVQGAISGMVNVHGRKWLKRFGAYSTRTETYLLTDSGLQVATREVAIQNKRQAQKALAKCPHCAQPLALLVAKG